MPHQSALSKRRAPAQRGRPIPLGVAHPNTQKKPSTLHRLWVVRGSALKKAVDEAAVEEVAEKEVKEEDTTLIKSLQHLSALGM